MIKSSCTRLSASKSEEFRAKLSAPVLLTELWIIGRLEVEVNICSSLMTVRMSLMARQVPTDDKPGKWRNLQLM
jgi:hypothetical protein